MSNGNSVKIRIEGDDSGYTSTIQGLAGKTKAGLADVKAGIDLATQALQKFASVAQKGINYNAEIEQLQTSFEVMTGSAEKAAETVERLKTMGAETPYDTAGLASVTQLLMQYGFTADDAIEKMSMLGDIAQGNAESMTSIATGYAQMSSAGKVNLQDIKQMINGGFNPLQEISERTGESMASLYDRISDGKMSVDEITESMKYATSEGGKFYQSMEKQSQTLSGQLSTLSDNVNELLGSLTSGLSDDLAGSVIPAVNEMIGQLQTAFDAGGIESLISTATDMIPDLLEMMNGRIESAINGIAKWAPKCAQSLMKALPGAIKSATSSIPQITSALFDVASTVLSDLVGMLPELIPSLLDGVIDTVKSVFTGAGDMIVGLFEGVEKAFHQGQTKILDSWVDDSKVVDYNLDVNITSTVTNNTDAEQIREDVQAAVDTVETALEGVEGIDPESVAEAMVSGDTTSALSAAFQKYGLDTASAEAVAAQITGGQTAINTAIEGLGLSEEAQAQLNEMISDENTTGADITAFLVSCGVDGEQATAAANTIISGRDQINTAIASLPTEISAQLLSSGFSFIGTRALLRTCLKMMGVDDATIESILGTYDTFSSSLTAKITGIYDDIEKTLTDGVPDDPKKMANLKAQVQEWAKNAHDQIAEWYNEEVEKLDTNDSDYATKIAELQARRDALDQSVDQSVDSVTTYIDSMAGQTTEYVQEHLDELQALAEQAGVISSEIDALGGKVTTEAELDYNLVRAGGKATEEEVSMAVKFVVDEYALDEQSAEDAYEKARLELKDDLANGKITQEEFEAKDTALQAERDAAIQAARELYDERVTELFKGMAESSGYDDAVAESNRLKEYASEIESNVDTEGYLDSIRSEVEEYVLGNGLATEVTDADLRTWALVYAKNLRTQSDEVLNGVDMTSLLSLFGQLSTGGYLDGTQYEGVGTLADLITAIYGEPEKVAEEVEEIYEEPLEFVPKKLARSAEREENPSAYHEQMAHTLEGVLDSFTDPEKGGVNYDALTDSVWKQIAESMGYDESAVEYLKSSLSAENIVNALQGLIDENYEAAENAVEETVIEPTEEAIAAATEKKENANILQDVLDGFFNEETGEIDYSAISDDVWKQIAEALGYDESAVEYLKSSLSAETIASTLQSLIDQNLTEAETALEGGYTGMYSSGSYTAQGALDALQDKETEFYNEGATLAGKVKAGYDDKIEIASPSKAMRRSGQFTGEGLVQGLRSSMKQAVTVAKSIGGEIVTAADLSQSMRVNVPDLAQEITIANEQNATPVVLDGKQIATIQGTNNRRQLAFERARIARGFGY